MKRIFFSIIIAIVTLNVHAQSVYVDNAFIFSNNDYGGTARFVGMGGAFGALGGDFSAIAINPAGLGVYRSSEFVFSPGLSYNMNDALYLGNSESETDYNANLNNLGFVASYNLENSDTRWVNFNFGVGINRTTNLNDKLIYQGINNSSLMQNFIEIANATTTDPYELDGMYEFLIWDSYIMDFDTAANEFYSEITDELAADPTYFAINQRKLMEKQGSISEFTFAFGGNYAHKLYIGASIGITRLRYDEYVSHYESETTSFYIPFIDSFEFREHSTTEGTGVNLKFGAIYKPIEFIRLGASLHIPTFYNLQQEFYNAAYGEFESINPDASKSAVMDYGYKLTTPMRAIGSVGFQIGKVGLIDVDYEYVDYSTMQLDDEFDQTYGVLQDNEDIETIFRETHNLRIGGEFRLGSLYFRGGGRYSTSPYKDINIVLNSDYSQTTYSAGLGYRENNFFVDFAFAQSMRSYNLIAYDHVDNNAEANIDNKVNNFVLTFGLRF